MPIDLATIRSHLADQHARSIERGVQRMFYESARNYHFFSGHPGEYGSDCLLCNPKPSRWRTLRARVSYWWHQHYPRLHFGPCPDDRW